MTDKKKNQILWHAGLGSLPRVVLILLDCYAEHGGLTMEQLEELTGSPSEDIKNAIWLINCTTRLARVVRDDDGYHRAYFSKAAYTRAAKTEKANMEEYPFDNEIL